MKKEDELMDENFVVAAAIRALETAGWTIRSHAMTNQTGVDIVAERDGRRLYVEAKGVTSSVRSSNRYGKLHTSGQMFISTAAALLKAAEMRCEFPDALIAIALPAHVGMHARIERIIPVLERAEIGVIWVESDGNVSEWNLAAL